ncbi:MAG: hypothetical protein AAB354_10375, partial [candidate division KSB1 bacterium]
TSSIPPLRGVRGVSLASTSPANIDSKELKSEEVNLNNHVAPNNTPLAPLTGGVKTQTKNGGGL